MSGKNSIIKFFLFITICILIITICSCSIVTNESPVAIIKAAPTSSASAPLEVLFDGSSSYDPDGQIVRYEWDFGDGSKGTGSLVSHVYVSRGVYTAKLTVIDDKGAFGISFVTIDVGGGSDVVTVKAKVNPPPGSSVNLAGLRAVSPFSESPIAESGDVYLGAYTVPAQLIVVKNQFGNAVFLTYLFYHELAKSYLLPNHIVSATEEIVIDEYSTALSLLMLHPVLAGSETHDKVRFAIKVFQDPRFNTLASEIAEAIRRNPSRSLSYENAPRVYQLVDEIAVSAVESLGSPSWALQPGALGKIYKDDRPYVEDGGNGKLIIKNEKAINYWAKAYEYGNNAQTSTIKREFTVTPAEWVFVFRIGPGFTEYQFVPNERITLQITEHQIFNGVLAILHIIDLGIPIPVKTIARAVEILQTFAPIVDNVLNCVIYPLGGASVVDVIQCVLSVLGNDSARRQIIKTLAEFLGREIKDDIIKTISGQVGNILKVLSLPEKLIFFYDFISSIFFPKPATYPLQWARVITYIPHIDDISVQQETMYAPATVVFSCSASDLDGTIVRYQWDFGDGSKGLGPTVSHVYQNPGVYTVTLQIQDNDGAWAIDTRTVTIKPRPQKVATSLTLFLEPSTIQENTDTTIKLSGRLTRRDTGQGLAGKQIAVNFFDIVKYAVTDVTGYYQTEYSLRLRSGSYEFSARFDGDDEYERAESRAVLQVTSCRNEPKIWTDQPSYCIGDTVKILFTVTAASYVDVWVEYETGATKYLVQNEYISDPTKTYVIKPTAGEPAGQRIIYIKASACGRSETASCRININACGGQPSPQPETLRFIGIISDVFWGIVVTTIIRVLNHPVQDYWDRYVGQNIRLAVDESGSPQIDRVGLGDIVEVSGKPDWESPGAVFLSKPYHYIKRIPGAGRLILTWITVNVESQGDIIKLSGRLARRDTGQGLGGKTIRFFYYPGNVWRGKGKEIRPVVTDSNGYFQTEVFTGYWEPSFYLIVAIFEGDEQFSPSSSNSDLVEVR